MSLEFISDLVDQEEMIFLGWLFANVEVECICKNV
jgi:hypothetical protein